MGLGAKRVRQGEVIREFYLQWGMTTLFISDLHLDPERPAITDLFEAWVGDDDPSESGAFVADRLRALRAAGVPVFFMRGNRDFLLGEDYARRAGMTILPDPAVVVLHGKPTLLTHGDLLCTGDTAYQQFRAQTRDPKWQDQFLSQPLHARLAFAQQARAASQAHQGGLAAQGTMESITDAAPDAVRATFARYGLDRMIHGHTHRPKVHEDEGGTRIVLGDWYEQGSVLRVARDGFGLSTL